MKPVGHYYDSKTMELVLVDKAGNETRLSSQDISNVFDQQDFIKDDIKATNLDYDPAPAREARNSYAKHTCPSCSRSKSKWCMGCINGSLYQPRVFVNEADKWRKINKLLGGLKK